MQEEDYSYDKCRNCRAILSDCFEDGQLCRLFVDEQTNKTRAFIFDQAINVQSKKLNVSADKLEKYIMLKITGAKALKNVLSQKRISLEKAELVTEAMSVSADTELGYLIGYYIASRKYANDTPAYRLIQKAWVDSIYEVIKEYKIASQDSETENIFRSIAIPTLLNSKEGFRALDSTIEQLACRANVSKDVMLYRLQLAYKDILLRRAIPD